MYEFNFQINVPVKVSRKKAAELLIAMMCVDILEQRDRDYLVTFMSGQIEFSHYVEGVLED